MKKVNLMLVTFVSLINLGQFSYADVEDNVVEFRIPAGTGSKPWNTPRTPVNVKVGDTLRIINDDSTPHTLHTFGRPCPHQPSESKFGDVYDCEIATTADPRVDTLYDHAFGITSRFYVNATK